MNILDLHYRAFSSILSQIWYRNKAYSACSSLPFTNIKVYIIIHACYCNTICF